MPSKNLEFIKVGAIGKFTYDEFRELNGKEDERITERHSQIEVVEVRSKDFIVKDLETGRKIYCSYPKNSSDGLETYTLTDDAKGYIKRIRDGFEDSRGKISITQFITFQF